MSQPRGSTFHDYTDLNGVEVSCNAHPAGEFGPGERNERPVDQRWVWDPVTGEGHYETPSASIVDRTRGRVLTQLGTSQSMSYGGDLRPRAERLPGAPDPEAEKCNSSGQACCPPTMAKNLY